MNKNRIPISGEIKLFIGDELTQIFFECLPEQGWYCRALTTERVISTQGKTFDETINKCRSLLKNYI